MTDGPELSVAVTTCNAGRHLDAQLASLVRQTRPPDEIVLHDDASTDGTWDRVQLFAAQSPVPVRVRREPRNVGLRRNVERALRACHGDVILLADQDDEWDEHKAEVARLAFRDGQVTLWFSDADLVDDRGTPFGRTAWSAVNFDPQAQDDVRQGRGLARLQHGQTVTGATMAVRRAVLDVALPLPVELEGDDHLFLHDGWLAVIGSCLGRVAVEPRPLTRYRQHVGQTTAMSLSVGSGGSAAPTVDPLDLESARTALVARRLQAAAVDSPAAREVLAGARYLAARRRLRAGSVSAAVDLARASAAPGGLGGRRAPLLRDLAIALRRRAAGTVSDPRRR